MAADTPVELVHRIEGPGLCAWAGCGQPMQHGVFCGPHSRETARARDRARVKRPGLPVGRVPTGRDALSPDLYWLDVDQAAAAIAHPPEHYPTGPCATSSADFFAEAVGPARRAQRVCATCPNLYPCLGKAVADREGWGVWGGTIRAERLRIARHLRARRLAAQPRDRVRA